MVISDDVCGGLDYFGCEDWVGDGGQSGTDKAIDFIKTAGPGLVAAAQNIAKKDDKKSDAKPEDKGSDAGGGGKKGKHGDSGSSGGLSTIAKVGIGLGAGLGALLLGFGIFKIVKR